MNSGDHLLLKAQYVALTSLLSVTFLNSLPVFLDLEFNSVFFLNSVIETIWRLFNSARDSITVICKSAQHMLQVFVFAFVLL